MNKKTTHSSKMVATKNKVLSCSTPEHKAESPSRDSDSLCDSEAASPVPFLCTQDGAEGETDVVWNFYTPKSENTAATRLKNSTPLSRKTKKYHKPPLIERPLPKRKPVKATQKNTELLQDLIELNQNLHELIAKKSKSNVVIEKQQSGSEDDIFNDSGESSPKSGLKTNSRCLRRNLLSSKFGKPDTETALESDDSMNECLIKASQVVEENILNQEPTLVKRKCYEQNSAKNVQGLRPGLKFKMDHDSMDAILNSIKLDSPIGVNKAKKLDSPHINNDSFDCYVGNLNDSALDRLTQMPVEYNTNNLKNKSTSSKDMDWTVQDLELHDGSPSSKSFFGRHSSMPESPTVTSINRPSTSGMVFGRYSSMPPEKNTNKCPGDSPLRCTPDEIKRKHQQAREKLHAKRLLPFTSAQQTNQSAVPSQLTQKTITKNTQFQPRVPSTTLNKVQNNFSVHPKTSDFQQESSNNTTSLKLLIEKKRQEALSKLRRRQPNKLT